VITAIVLVLALAVPIRRAGPVLVAAAVPEAAIAAVAAGLVLEARRIRRRTEGDDEVLALLGIAAELRAGRTLKAAAAAAGDRAPGLDFSRVRRRVEAGRPGDEVAEALGAALPRHGRMARAALRVGATTGGRMVEAFETAAVLARADDDLVREQRAATAQAGAGAAVLVGLPMLMAAGRLTSGDLTGPGGAAVGAGLVLLLLGALAMALIVRWTVR
jgi:Flp pilus assembly protein TadB